jgi:diguanylate cyclase
MPTLKDLLYRTLTLALSSLLKPNPALATESEALGLAVREANNEPELNQVASRLKQLCFQIELQSATALSNMNYYCVYSICY